MTRRHPSSFGLKLPGDMAGVARDDGKSYGVGTPWTNAQAVRS